jgi:phosphoserine phosphatase RsbU/P
LSSLTGVLALVMGAAFVAAVVLWVRALRAQRGLEAEIRRLRSERERVTRFSEAMAAALRDGASRPELFEHISAAMVRSMEAVRGAVFEATRDDRLRGAAVTGLFPPQGDAARVDLEAASDASRAREIERVFRSETLAVGEAVVGEVAKSLRPILVADAARDRRVARNADPSLAIRSLLAVPMIDGESLVGVMAVADPTDGAGFTAASVGLMEALAEHAVLALRLQAVIAARQTA